MTVGDESVVITAAGRLWIVADRYVDRVTQVSASLAFAGRRAMRPGTSDPSTESPGWRKPSRPKWPLITAQNDPATVVDGVVPTTIRLSPELVNIGTTAWRWTSPASATLGSP